MAIELPDGRSESNEVLEALRLRALHARELGYQVVDIAAILGVREETVSRWCVKYERGGEEALPGDRTGRPIGSGRLLDPQQEQVIRGDDHLAPEPRAVLANLPADVVGPAAGQVLRTRTPAVYLRLWDCPAKPEQEG